VLITAKRQHEERKVEFMGCLLANVAFHAEIDEHLANWLIRMIDELSWMQLCLLSAVAQKGKTKLPDVEIGKSCGSWSSWGVHEQLTDLGFYKGGLICGQSETQPPKLPVYDLSLAGQELTNRGRLLVEMAWLRRIDQSAIALAIDLLESH